ncbi:pilus assembly PilX N-terminal domain-containing protein [Patescibacteria group bacterium]|nr:pilus assembly PilX N-terminal domain-containing protein [Patescibacteria group bacterium]
MLSLKNNQRGFAAFFITILVLAIMFGIAISLAVLTLGQQRISGNIVKSSQAYYVAEAGIEDILLRLTNVMNWSNPYTLDLGDGFTTIEISDFIGGSRVITSEGNMKNRIRKIQVVHQVSTQEISFYYGAQIGDGGMEMGNNARVKGNVFSNSSVIAPVRGFVDDSIQVAKSGNRIDGLIVGKDTWSHTCKDSSVGGTLTYVSGGSLVNCTAGGEIREQPNEIEPRDLPILQSVIDNWKVDAEGGGEVVGDYILDGKVTEYLGPQKITGNLTLDNKAILIMTGTIWVVGDVLIRNEAGIKLDPVSYGGMSGVLLVDGKIKIRPGVILEGSGQEGSYLLLLSTSPSLDKLAPAIEVDNTTAGGIFYTNQGLIVIRNNVVTREVTGYQVYLEENAIIDYETGLEDTCFTSGPGGSWELASWKEIE